MLTAQTDKPVMPKGDWMRDGFLTGVRGGIICRKIGASWYAELDGLCFGPAHIYRYSDADYLEVDGTAWEYCLDSGEHDRLADRGFPTVDRR